ncbi:MAG: DUF4423 domain-containing protein, partial [Pseudomonadota bacterium]
KKIGLSKMNKRLFLTSVDSVAAKGPLLRQAALRKMQKLMDLKDKFHEIPIEKFKGINHWKFLASLEVVSLNAGHSHSQALMDRFGFSLNESRQILQRLIDLKLIQSNENGSESLVQETSVGEETKSRDIQSFHLASMNKAASRLQTPIETREFIHSIFSIDSSRLGEAKTQLREFVEKFSQEFATNSEPAEVYQLGVQFVSLEERSQ